MPGYVVDAYELCTFISTDQQPSSLDACAQLSAEEKLVVEQGLSVFRKPVEFYNILHHRNNKLTTFPTEMFQVQDTGQGQQ
ncbi:unnamed protein product [Lathyrus oleraceus]